MLGVLRRAGRGAQAARTAGAARPGGAARAAGAARAQAAGAARCCPNRWCCRTDARSRRSRCRSCRRTGWAARRCRCWCCRSRPSWSSPRPEPVEPEAPAGAAADAGAGGRAAAAGAAEVCAHDTVARPSRAAATAALSCFAITMVLSFGWGRLQPQTMQAGCRATACALQNRLAVVPGPLRFSARLRRSP